ncbi:50S ribosomal protein L17 [Helicobacter aurati]|uniref:Large ribosomal subunit protein bL17 n=1 Tax=Helicobacter aurati TaxID=137778 RepID=A0A3D8J4G8_9HELI|nr:50S ribosomal protein L17 [Helicobacter aurati]RDU72368.1 50S ribosomal protein L17 [Helicobacter aurati]
MRHKHGYRKLGRTSAHRKALLKNLSIALITHKRIETTLYKAKELQQYIERLIGHCKVENFNTHRYIFAELQDKKATKQLITELAPKLLVRNGGYTRIQRSRIRKGDAATMAVIELIY